MPRPPVRPRRSWMNHSVHLFLLSPRGFDAPSCSDAISQVDIQSAKLLAIAMRVSIHIRVIYRSSHGENRFSKKYFLVSQL